MTDNIGLYVMGFMLAFGAICWLASVVCAWFCEPKQEPEAPYKIEPRSDYFAEKPYIFDDKAVLMWDGKAFSIKPVHADYLADCEWPDSPHRRKVTSEDLDEIARIIKEN